ncbi:MAG: hypothetical protein KI790_14730 [Cyclobacteriaceae bacterium]|nr:hypothetical protein [Cyclobacteriaceae bacterium HetDA_MAG_MS6]
MKHYLLVFFVLSTIGLQAQFSSDFWHDGLLVTSEKDTLRGQVKYNMETNVVQVLQNKKLSTYSSFKIFYFEFYDKVINNYRQFYTLPYNLKSDYKTPVIFELLYEGPLSLLSRESIVQETVSTNSPYWNGGNLTQTTLDYAYFFLDKKGNMEYFNGRKAVLLSILSDKDRQVRDFIKKNRLRVDNTRDLVRITAFYNSI